MVPVRVVGVAVDAGMQPVILLRPVVGESEPRTLLPIWVGPQEAASISLAIEGGTSPRPLSHDLMTSMLGALGVELQRVDITRLEAGTFFAEITLGTAAGTRVLDSRPSDAIALALRSGSPIWVDDDVVAEAGVLDESDQPDAAAPSEQSTASAPSSSIEAAATEVSQESQLAEFRRFIDDVDPEDFGGS